MGRPRGKKHWRYLARQKQEEKRQAAYLQSGTMPGLPEPSSSQNIAMVLPDPDPEAEEDNRNRNPLLIGEIADNVLSFLENTDLVAAFDVCQLWRSLVPSHNIRLQKIRAPVEIRGNLRNTAGTSYLDSLRKHESFKATKFVFKNTNLNSQEVVNFLEQNGAQMEELELHYTDDVVRSWQARPTVDALAALVSLVTLRDLLTTQAPNLKTLIITNLKALLKWTRNVDILRIGIGDEETVAILGLTRIKIDSDFMWYSISPFIVQLLRASPALVDFELVDQNIGRFPEHFVDDTVTELVNSNRLTQLRSLKLQNGNPRLLNRLLPLLAAAGQLNTFAFTSNAVVSPYQSFQELQNILHIDAALVQNFLTGKCEDLKYLELTLERLQHPQLILPPMPNLMELKLKLTKISVHPQTADEIVHLGIVDYATDFPQLKLIGFKGKLRNYLADEIYPDPDHNLIRPSTSVQILQEIPDGVDQALMARIGRLFPNLKIIRVAIPYQFESLLVSIWEFCQNISELFLTLDKENMDGEAEALEEHIEENEDDPGQGSQEPRQSLDSLFSGIPEAECRRLRALSADELAEVDFGFGGLRNETDTMIRPSLLNLQKLSRLCINGPSRKLGEYLAADHDEDQRGRVDKLSDVFAYSTLAFHRQLTFFQIQIKLMSTRRFPALTKFSQAAIQHVCIQASLEQVKRSGKTRTGFDSQYLRFIRPGVGLEKLGPVPMKWYGLPDSHPD